MVDYIMELSTPLIWMHLIGKNPTFVSGSYLTTFTNGFRLFSTCCRIIICHWILSRMATKDRSAIGCMVTVSDSMNQNETNLYNILLRLKSIVQTY